MVNFVEAPAVSPLPFGLLSVATVIDGGPDHWPLGTSYLPDYCGASYVTEGACVPADLGTLILNTIDDTGLAEDWNSTGIAVGDYEIDWGDGDVEGYENPGPTTFAPTHDYVAAGDYIITITGPDGFLGRLSVEVSLDDSTGPFDAEIFHTKVPVDGTGEVEGYPFAVYHLFSCRYPGSGGEAAVMDRARKGLSGGEGRAVESVMARYMAEHESAVDLTPVGGTPVHPVEAVALLEAYAAANYGGVPTLHAGRDLTTLLTTHGTVDRYGSRLETVQGTLCASGAGYDALPAPGDAEAAGAGEAWVYVTGQVVARRAEVITAGPAKVPGSNEFNVLAERPYVLSTECIVAAVLVATGYAEPAA